MFRQKVSEATQYNSIKKKGERKIIKELNKNLSLIYPKCLSIFNKFNKEKIVSEKEYIWFIFSADIYYRIKDIIILNKKLKEAKNNFDSSLYVLSRSVLEDFIYFKYLLSEEDKINYRLQAFICYSTRKNEITILNSIQKLAQKGKFIFDNNPNNILSSKEKIDEKIEEWKLDIKKYNDSHKDDPNFENEINIFKKIESVAQEYDKIKNIKSISSESENISMEWMYHYLYRFLSMSTHSSLREKEKIFSTFNNAKEPNNIHILNLLNDISKQILIL